MLNARIGRSFYNYGPIILLYYLSISEIDTHFENYFSILSFNIQFIVIYFWVLKRPAVLGNGHIFLAGLINDVVMSFPLGSSSLSYLAISFVATYIRNMSVNSSIISDTTTFLIASIIAKLVFYVLISNFSEISITYTGMFYNVFFSLLFFPPFWLIFKLYNSNITIGKNA
tara:strand:- start:259 stop:771 length:513 start_codon:yes stop_codon:yes gene_type:complete